MLPPTPPSEWSSRTPRGPPKPAGLWSSALNAETLDAPRRQRRARVTITSRRRWRIRVARELPRYLICSLSVAGLLASARFAIAPPRPIAVPGGQRLPTLRDAAAEGYAVLFTRRYLSWNAAVPAVSGHALEQFVGLEGNAGVVLPTTGEQSVQWAEVVQARERAPGEHVYTVAAQTDTAGLLYLSVGVDRRAGSGLAIAGYPAFVGAPATGPAPPPAHAREVDDPALAIVVERSLRNYLAASAGELAADLSSGARVSLPSLALSLDSLEHLAWSPAGGAVEATVEASDQRGARYTLGYELDVLRAQGRWEISAVQMDPDT